MAEIINPHPGENGTGTQLVVFSLCTFFPVVVFAITTHFLFQFQFLTLWSVQPSSSNGRLR